MLVNPTNTLGVSGLEDQPFQNNIFFFFGEKLPPLAGGLDHLGRGKLECY